MTTRAVSSFEPVGHFGIVFTDTAPRHSNTRFADVAAGAIDTHTRP
jgi:hypothetical protein